MTMEPMGKHWSFKMSEWGDPGRCHKAGTGDRNPISVALVSQGQGPDQCFHGNRIRCESSLGGLMMEFSDWNYRYGRGWTKRCFELACLAVWCIWQLQPNPGGWGGWILEVQWLFLTLGQVMVRALTDRRAAGDMKTCSGHWATWKALGEGEGRGGEGGGAGK